MIAYSEDGTQEQAAINLHLQVKGMRWVSAAFSAIMHMNTSLQLAAMMRRFMFGMIET